MVLRGYQIVLFCLSNLASVLPIQFSMIEGQQAMFPLSYNFTCFIVGSTLLHSNEGCDTHIEAFTSIHVANACAHALYFNNNDQHSKFWKLQ